MRATSACNGLFRVVNEDDLLVPRFPRGTPANRLWDYVHVGPTVMLPAAIDGVATLRGGGNDAHAGRRDVEEEEEEAGGTAGTQYSTGGATVHVAPVGDARGCPLKEVNPRYRGFVPPWAFEWSRTNLPAFYAQEARTVWRLLTRGGVAAHYMTAYDAALCRCLAAGRVLRVEEVSGAQGALPDEPEYLDLLRATWGD